MSALRAGNTTILPFKPLPASSYQPPLSDNGTASDVRLVGPNTVWVRNINPYDAAYSGVNVTGVNTQRNYTACLASYQPVHEACCQQGGGTYVYMSADVFGEHLQNSTDAKDPASGNATAPALLRWCALPYLPFSPTSNGPFQLPQANDDWSQCMQNQTAEVGGGRKVNQAAADVTIDGSVVWECHAFSYSQSQGPGQILTGLNEYSAAASNSSSSNSSSAASRGLSKSGWLGAAVGLIAVLPVLAAGAL